LNRKLLLFLGKQPKKNELRYMIISSCLLVKQTNINPGDYRSACKKFTMKKLHVTAIIILFATSVNAQIGMPKELTCTEEAFNFSFSVGTKWKLSSPKMGPAEIIRNEPGDLSAWSFKNGEVTPEKHSLPIFNNRFSSGLGLPVNQQNHFPLTYPNMSNVMDEHAYPFPAIDFSSLINYTIWKPGFLVN